MPALTLPVVPWRSPALHGVGAVGTRVSEGRTVGAGRRGASTERTGRRSMGLAEIVSIRSLDLQQGFDEVT